MDLLITSSLVAAFIAGIAALFAPCCITVLLPAYLGSVFREKYRVFLMTFLFFLGVLAVFLPIGLGAAALAQAFSTYHNEIFAGAGVMLTILGATMLLGKRFSLPFHVNPSLKNHHVFSVFALGVLSAIATTCCAPVLAGVLALTALPGSVFWGAVYTLSYVLGMTMPLFVIALFLDRANFTKKFMAFRKTIRFRFFGKDREITVAEAISGATFFIMGIFILYLAATNQLFSHSSYQVAVNIYLTQLLESINRFVKFVPEYVWALFIVGLAAFIVRLAFLFFKKEQHGNNQR